MASNIQEYILSLQDKFSATAGKAAAAARHFSIEATHAEVATEKLAIAQSRTNSFMMGAGKLLLAGGGLIAGFKAIQLFNGSLREGQEEQAFNKSYETLLKSKEAASSILKQLDGLNRNSTISEGGIKEAGKTFLGVGVQASKLTNTLSRLGDISQGNEGKFSSMVDVYAKAKQKGFVESRMITEIPGALDEFSKMTGKSGVELRKFMAEGTIGINELDEVIRRMTDNGGRYFGGMADQMQTDVGKAIQAEKAVADLQESIGLKLLPAHTKWLEFQAKFIDRMTVGVEWIYRNSEAFKTAAKAALVFGAAIITYNVASYAVAIVSTVRALSALSIGYRIGAAAAAAFNVVMNLNPYVALATAIVAVGTAFYFLAQGSSAAAKAQEVTNNVRADAMKRAVEEKQKADQLLAIIRDETAAREDQITALTQLKQKSGEYFEDLTLQSAKTDAGTDALKRYGDAITDNYMAIAAQQKMVQIGQAQIEAQLRMDEIKKNWEGSTAGVYFGNYGLQVSMSNQQKVLDGLSAQADSVTKMIKRPDILNADKIDDPDGTDLSKNKKDLATGIAGGGVQTMNISLGKFYENIIFNGTTIDKDVNTVADMAVKALLRILNSANKIQAGTN